MMSLGNFETKFVEKWLCCLNTGNNVSYFVNLFSGRCVTVKMKIFNVFYSEKYGEFYGVCVIQIGFLHVAMSPCNFTETGKYPVNTVHTHLATRLHCSGMLFVSS